MKKAVIRSQPYPKWRLVRDDRSSNFDNIPFSKGLVKITVNCTIVYLVRVLRHLKKGVPQKGVMVLNL